MLIHHLFIILHVLLLLLILLLLWRHLWLRLIDTTTYSSSNLPRALSYTTTYGLWFITIRSHSIRRGWSLNTRSTRLDLIGRQFWFLHRIVVCGSVSRTSWTFGAIRWKSFGSSAWLRLLKLIVSLPGARSIIDFSLWWRRPNRLFWLVIWIYLFFGQNEIIIEVEHLTDRLTSSLIQFNDLSVLTLSGKHEVVRFLLQGFVFLQFLHPISIPQCV